MHYLNKNNWQHFGYCQGRQGRTPGTTTQNYYAHCTFLAAPFICAVKSHRGRCKEQTPSHLYFFKRAATEPTLCWSYKGFAGITAPVQWDCNIIFFQSRLNVRMTLSGAPATSSVPSLIVTKVLSTMDESWTGFYIKNSDTQKETAGIRLSCQWHMSKTNFNSDVHR